MPTKYSYFIVYPPGSQNRGKIQVFQQWLLEQVQPAERKSAVDAQAEHDASVAPPVRRQSVAAHAVKLLPNMGRPLFDSARDASS